MHISCSAAAAGVALQRLLRERVFCRRFWVMSLILQRAWLSGRKLNLQQKLRPLNNCGAWRHFTSNGVRWQHIGYTWPYLAPDPGYYISTITITIAMTTIVRSALPSVQLHGIQSWLPSPQVSPCLFVANYHLQSATHHPPPATQSPHWAVNFC